MKPLILAALLLIVSCSKQSHRVVHRVKQLYSEDSLLHPLMHAGYQLCQQDTLRDSVFTEIWQQDSVTNGYIYTKESPQELYYKNGRFHWADDLDSVVYDEIVNY